MNSFKNLKIGKKLILSFLTILIDSIAVNIVNEPTLPRNINIIIIIYS